MKKKHTYLLIIAVLIVGLLATGSSFAFWLWMSDNSNSTSIRFNTGVDLTDSIIYDSGESTWAGDFQIGSMCNGIHNTVSFYKTANAPQGEYYATINMDINSIGSNIASRRGVKWAITEGDSNSCGTPLRQGTFLGTKDGDTLEIYNGIKVTTTEKKYTVWMWIDGTENPSYLLSGETIDTSVWTEIDLDEEDKFEITNVNANYQEIDVSVINTKNNITQYAVTTYTSTPSSWTDIASPAKYYNLQYLATNAGSYYFWFKDSTGAMVSTAKASTITTGGTSATIPATQTIVTKDTTGPECTWEYYPSIQNGTWTATKHAFALDKLGNKEIGVVSGEMITGIEYTKGDQGHILLTCRDSGVGLGNFQALTSDDFYIYRRELGATAGEGTYIGSETNTNFVNVTGVTGSAITLPTSNPNYQGGVNTEAWQYRINLTGSTLNGQMSMMLVANRLYDRASNGNASVKTPWIFVNKIAPTVTAISDTMTLVYNGSSQRIISSGSQTMYMEKLDHMIYDKNTFTCSGKASNGSNINCIMTEEMTGGKTYTIIEGVNAGTYTVSIGLATGYAWLIDGIYSDQPKSFTATILPATPNITTTKGIAAVVNNYCENTSSTKTLSTVLNNGRYIVNVKPPVANGTVTGSGVVTNAIKKGSITPNSLNTAIAKIKTTNPSSFNGNYTVAAPIVSTITFEPVSRGAASFSSSFVSDDTNYVNTVIGNTSNVVKVSATNSVYDGKIHYVYINSPLAGFKIVNQETGSAVPSTIAVSNAADTNYNLISKTNVGTYTTTYTITSSGYEGISGAASIVITPKCIADSDITVYQDGGTVNKVYAYVNEERKPVITVKYNNGSSILTLVEGTDYTITWPTDSTNVGTKVGTITGIGNYACGSNSCYSGTRTRTFTYTIAKIDPIIEITPVNPSATPIALNCLQIGTYTTTVKSPFENDPISGTLSVLSSATNYVLANAAFSPRSVISDVGAAGSVSTNTYVGKATTAEMPTTIALTVTFTPSSIDNSGINYNPVSSTLLVGTVSRIDPETSVTGTSGTPKYKQTISATVTTNSTGNRIFKWYVSDYVSGANPTMVSSATVGNGTNTDSYTVGSGLAGKYLYVTVDVLKDTCYYATSATHFFGDDSGGGNVPLPIIRIASPMTVTGSTITFNAVSQNLAQATNVPFDEDPAPVIKYIIDTSGSITTSPFSGSLCNSTYSVITVNGSAETVNFAPKELASIYNSQISSTGDVIWWCSPEIANYYAKEGHVTSKINRYNISSGTSQLSCYDYTYSGNAYMPNANYIVPIPNGSSLTLSSNWSDSLRYYNTHSYSNNINAGTAKVTYDSPQNIEGSNYIGSATDTFTINKLTPEITFTGGTYVYLIHSLIDVLEELGDVDLGTVSSSLFGTTTITSNSVSSVPYGSCLFLGYSSVLPSTVTNCGVSSSVIGSASVAYSTNKVRLNSFTAGTIFSGNDIYYFGDELSASMDDTNFPLLKMITSDGPTLNITTSVSNNVNPWFYFHPGSLTGATTIVTTLNILGSGTTGTLNYNSVSSSFTIGSVSQGKVQLSVNGKYQKQKVFDGFDYAGSSLNITNSCGFMENESTLMGVLTPFYYEGSDCSSSTIAAPAEVGTYSFRVIYNALENPTYDYAKSISNCSTFKITQAASMPVTITGFNGTIDCGTAFNPTYSSSLITGNITSNATISYGTVTTASGSTVNTISKTKVISGNSTGTLDELGWNDYQTGTYYVHYKIDSRNYTTTSGSVAVVIKPKVIDMCGYGNVSGNRTKIYDKLTTLSSPITLTLPKQSALTLSTTDGKVCQTHTVGATYVSASYDSVNAGSKTINVNSISLTGDKTSAYSLKNTSCAFTGANGGTITPKPLLLDTNEAPKNLVCKKENGTCMILETGETVYESEEVGCFKYGDLSRYYALIPAVLQNPVTHGGIVFGPYTITPLVNSNCVISGDDVGATYNLGVGPTYSTKYRGVNAGTYLIDNDVYLTGNDANNYYLANSSGGTSSTSTIPNGAIVKNRSLCDYVTTTNYSGIYDGNGGIAKLTSTWSGATIYWGTATNSMTQAGTGTGTFNIGAATLNPDVGTYTYYYKVKAANYEDCSGMVTSKITPKELTPTARCGNTASTALNKVYDCTTVIPNSCSLNVSVNGVVSGDNISTSYSSATYAAKTIGAKNVLVSGISISGSKAFNYTLSSSTIVLSGGTIGAYSTAISDMTGSPLTKTYDCTNGAPSGFALSNVKIPTKDVNGNNITCTDVFNVSFGSATYINSNSNYASNRIVVNNVSLNGADAGNYVLTSTNGTVTGVATITKGVATVSVSPTSATIPFWGRGTYNYTVNMPTSCNYNDFGVAVTLNNKTTNDTQFQSNLPFGVYFNNSGLSDSLSSDLTADRILKSRVYDVESLAITNGVGIGSVVTSATYNIPGSGTIKVICNGNDNPICANFDFTENSSTISALKRSTLGSTYDNCSSVSFTADLYYHDYVYNQIPPLYILYEAIPSGVATTFAPKYSLSYQSDDKIFNSSTKNLVIGGYDDNFIESNSQLLLHDTWMFSDNNSGSYIIGKQVGDYSALAVIAAYENQVNDNKSTIRVMGNGNGSTTGIYFTPATMDLSIKVHPIPFAGHTGNVTTASSGSCMIAAVSNADVSPLSLNNVPKSGTIQYLANTLYYTTKSHNLFEASDESNHSMESYIKYTSRLSKTGSVYSEQFNLVPYTDFTPSISSITNVPTTNCVSMSYIDSFSGQILNSERCSTVLTITGKGNFSGTHSSTIYMFKGVPKISLPNGVNSIYSGTAIAYEGVPTITLSYPSTSGTDVGSMGTNTYYMDQVTVNPGYNLTYYTGNSCSNTTTSANSGAASDGAAPVWTGTYSVRAVSNTNSNLVSATSNCVSYTIGCKTLTVGTGDDDNIKITNKNVTFNGNGQASGITVNVPEPLIVKTSSMSFTSSASGQYFAPSTVAVAGTYVTAYTITNAHNNYCAATVNSTLSIPKKTVVVTNPTCPTIAYGESGTFNGHTVKTGVSGTYCSSATGNISYGLIEGGGTLAALPAPPSAVTSSNTNIVYPGTATSSGLAQRGFIYRSQNVGAYKISATFTPDTGCGANYIVGKSTVTCNVNKAVLPDTFVIITPVPPSDTYVTFTPVTSTYNCSNHYAYIKLTDYAVSHGAGNSTITSGLTESLGNVVVSGGRSGTLLPGVVNAGTYGYYYFISNENYDTSSTRYQANVVTVKKALPIVTVNSKTATYTGSPITTTGTASVAGCAATQTNLTTNALYYSSTNCSGATISAPVLLGTYSVKGTVALTTNTDSSTSACGALTITPSTIDVSKGNYSGVYDGVQHSASLAINNWDNATIYYGTTNYGTVTSSYPYSVAAPTKGTYYSLSSVKARAPGESATVYYAVTHTGCNVLTGSLTIDIRPATFDIDLDGCGASYTYVDYPSMITRSASIKINNLSPVNDLAFSAYVASFGNTVAVPVGNVMAINDRQWHNFYSVTNVGTYDVSATVFHNVGGYVPSTITTCPIIINPATFVVTPTSTTKTYDGNTYYASVKVTNTMGATIWYGTSSACTDSTASCSYSATNSSPTTAVTFTQLGRSGTGTTTVYYRIEKANYSSTSRSVNVVINPATFNSTLYVPGANGATTTGNLLSATVTYDKDVDWERYCYLGVGNLVGSSTASLEYWKRDEDNDLLDHYRYGVPVSGGSFSVLDLVSGDVYGRDYTYTSTYTLSHPGYTTKNGTCSIVVKPASFSITLDPSVGVNATYNCNPQDLKIKVTNPNLTTVGATVDSVLYSSSDPGSQTSTIITGSSYHTIATRVLPYTGNVIYRVIKSHFATASGTIPFKIVPASLATTLSISGGAATYTFSDSTPVRYCNLSIGNVCANSSSQYGEISLAGIESHGDAWNEDLELSQNTTIQLLNVGCDGVGTNTINYVATMPGYNSVAGSCKIVLNAATFAVTPTSTTKSYDGNTYNASIKITNTTGAKIWYGTNSACTGSTSSCSYSTTNTSTTTPVTLSSIGRSDTGTTTIYYRIEKCGYTSATGSVKVVINPVTFTITPDPVNGVNATYNCNYQDLLLGLSNPVVSVSNATVNYLQSTVTTFPATANLTSKAVCGSGSTCSVSLVHQMDPYSGSVYYVVSRDKFTSATGALKYNVAAATFNVSLYLPGGSGGAATYTYSDATPTRSASLTVSNLCGPATLNIGGTNFNVSNNDTKAIFNWGCEMVGHSETVSYTLKRPGYTTKSDVIKMVLNPATFAVTPISITKTYDGNTYYASVKVTNTTGATIWYGTDSNCANSPGHCSSSTTNTSTATAVTFTQLGRVATGTTTIYYYITKCGYTSATGSVKVVINPAAFNVDLVGCGTSYTYSDATPTRSASIIIGPYATHGGIVSSLKFKATNLATTTSITFPTSGTTYNIMNVGCSDVNSNGGVSTIVSSYTVSHANYTTKNGACTVSISPATFAVTTTSPTKTYDGTAYDASVKVTNTTGATIWYGTDSNCANSPGYCSSSTMNTSTATAVTLASRSATGTTTMYYRIMKCGYSSTYGSVKVVINPAALSVTKSSYSGVYDGNNHYVTVGVTNTTGATIWYGTTSACTGSTASCSSYTTVTSTSTPATLLTKSLPHASTIYYRILKTNYSAVSGAATFNITARDFTVSSTISSWNGTSWNGVSATAGTYVYSETARLRNCSITITNLVGTTPATLSVAAHDNKMSDEDKQYSSTITTNGNSYLLIDTTEDDVNILGSANTNYGIYTLKHPGYNTKTGTCTIVLNPATFDISTASVNTYYTGLTYNASINVKDKASGTAMKSFIIKNILATTAPSNYSAVVPSTITTTGWTSLAGYNSTYDGNVYYYLYKTGYSSTSGTIPFKIVPATLTTSDYVKYGCSATLPNTCSASLKVTKGNGFKIESGLSTSYGNTITTNSSSSSIYTLLPAASAGGQVNNVYFRVTNPNYVTLTGTVPATITGTFNVEKTSVNYPYSGSVHQAMVRISNVTGVKIEYGTSTSYGNVATTTTTNAYTLLSASLPQQSSTIYYRLSKNLYKTVTGSVTLKIVPATLSITKSGNGTYTYADGVTRSCSIALTNLVAPPNATVTGVVCYDSGCEFHASNISTTITNNQAKAIFAATPNASLNNVGSYYGYYSVQHPGYLDASGSCVITINPATLSIEANGYSGTYDGTAHYATVKVKNTTGAKIIYGWNTSYTGGTTTTSSTSTAYNISGTSSTFSVLAYYKVSKLGYITSSSYVSFSNAQRTFSGTVSSPMPGPQDFSGTSGSFGMSFTYNDQQLNYSLYLNNLYGPAATVITYQRAVNNLPLNTYTITSAQSWNSIAGISQVGTHALLFEIKHPGYKTYTGTVSMSVQKGNFSINTRSVNKVYDGVNDKAGIRVTNTTGATIQYILKPSSASPTSYSNSIVTTSSVSTYDLAGTSSTYDGYVHFKITKDGYNERTGSISYVVNPATFVVEVLSSVNTTYDGTRHDIKMKVTGVSGATIFYKYGTSTNTPGAYDSGSVSSGTSGQTVTIPGKTDAYDGYLHYLVYKDGYTSIQGYVRLYVGKAQLILTAGTLSGTYNGSSRTLKASVNAPNATIYYLFTTTSASPAMMQPSTTTGAAGASVTLYTCSSTCNGWLHYGVEAGSNYTTTSGSIRVLVEPATLSITTGPVDEWETGTTYYAKIKVTNTTGVKIEYGWSTSYGSSTTTSSSTTYYNLVGSSVATNTYVYYRATKDGYTTKSGSISFKLTTLSTFSVTTSPVDHVYDGGWWYARIKVTNTTGATINYGWSTSYGSSTTTSSSTTYYNLSGTNVATTTYVYYKITKTGYKDKTGSISFDLGKSPIDSTNGVFSSTCNYSTSGTCYATYNISDGVSSTISYGSSTAYGNTITVSSGTGNLSNLGRAKNSPGTTKIYYKVSRGSNWQDATGTITVVVNQAPSLNATVNGFTLPYDGGNHYAYATITATTGATIHYGTSSNCATNSSSCAYSATNSYTTGFALTKVSRSSTGTTTLYYIIEKAGYTSASGSVKLIITPDFAVTTSVGCKMTTSGTAYVKPSIQVTNISGATIKYSTVSSSSACSNGNTLTTSSSTGTRYNINVSTTAYYCITKSGWNQKTGSILVKVDSTCEALAG